MDEYPGEEVMRHRTIEGMWKHAAVLYGTGDVGEITEKTTHNMPRTVAMKGSVGAFRKGTKSNELTFLFPYGAYKIHSTHCHYHANIGGERSCFGIATSDQMK